MHHRLRPKVHRFQHAYYFCSFDAASLESLDRSVKGFGYNRFSPLSIHDEDYIDSSRDPIPVKLKRWLEKRNYTREFDHVRLVTSPRYFNYVFNPVSFYLCYDAREQLQTVVAEVNNTFKERHIYVVDDLVPQQSGWASARNTAKAFHVSPFNSMDGEYEFRVYDNDSELRIDVDIIKNGEKVFYSALSGKAAPFNTGSLWRAILRFPLRPVMTFPRILWEAGKLYFAKRLSVYTKPQPSSDVTTSTRRPSPFQRMAMKAVLNVFSGIDRGALSIILPDGSEMTFGKKSDDAPEGVMRIRDYRFFTCMLLRGSIGLGESFVEGYWDTDDPGSALMPMALSLNSLQSSDGSTSLLTRVSNSLHHALRRNSRSNSRKNIQEHYDLGNDFYQTFLDPSLTYSSGIYANTDDTLETAQLNKLDAMIRKADLKAEHHLLEIGSGWGSLAIRAAQTTGCRVTTITLSEEQHRLASERVREAGLEDRVDVRICDYRDMTGAYDRIISIEMLEAVGHEYLNDYFSLCRKLLKPGGKFVVQVITIPDERYEAYRRNCDWIQKYIFPGGHLPSLGAIKNAISATRSFDIIDLEDIGLDYGRTLKDWRERFVANLSQVRALGYDDTFIRKWIYYLSYCEAGFTAKQIFTHQIVFHPTLES